MQKAFDTFKRVLTKAPVLTYPDFTETFFVATDTSKRAVGSVLSPNGQNRQERPIHYAGRGLNDHQKNYSTNEREGLVIVFALKKFRHYLLC